ncbi:MAG: DUF368 domain-containing protein, partial [Myxococcales bacterium]|nr:DUF368 domain-containing protein [Myxococcales bacterium]
MLSQFVLFLKGFAMGIAEVIPGVSGGTLALVTGIYSRFILGIKSIDLKLLRALFTGAFWRALIDRLKNPRPFDAEAAGDEATTVAFFIVLLAGMGIAILIGIRIIPALLTDYPAPTKGFFLGLVLASIVIPYRLMERKGAVEILCLIVAAFGTYALMGIKMDRSAFASGEVVLRLSAPATEPLTIPEGTRIGKRLPAGQRHSIIFQTTGDFTIGKGQSEIRVPVLAVEAGTKHNIAAGALQMIVVDKHSPAGSRQLADRLSVHQPADWQKQKGSDPALWFVFVCGAIAISAMILPGISGSFLLLMLGLYRYIIGGLSDLLYYKAWGNIAPLALFTLGILIGITAFSRVLAFLLKRYPSPTMAVLIGLMLGSARRLWPFQRTLGPDSVNILPSTADPHLIATLALFFGAAAIVIALETVGQRRDASPEQP